MTGSPVSPKRMIRSLLRLTGYDLIGRSEIPPEFPVDFEPETIEIIRCVRPFTMNGDFSVNALCQAVRYVVHNQISGDIVECGVWKGGSMLAVALTLIKVNSRDRNLFLFDTFAGMTEPTHRDIEYNKERAEETKAEWLSKQGEGSNAWCFSSLDEVKETMQRSGYDSERIHYVKGRVENTLPHNAPQKISLLRLDTDWYESTLHELQTLFPRLSVGGILILDDYGHWRGARQATDEYLAKHHVKMFLQRVDYTCRIGVKLQ